MEIFNIINEVEDLVENSPKIPMTSRLLVDEEKLLDLLDRLRTALPEELRQAKRILADKEKMLEECKKEARRIMEDAQKQLERQAEESEIVSQARAIAQEIVDKAEKLAREIKHGAYGYADDKLKEVEDVLSRAIHEVQSGRQEIQDLLKRD
ncbi:MAG: ATPase [Bacillota bacterium]|uniref:hypothetical protein n=1 Tax=Desulfurispora thermophila TaxID=265470 RepID=UPI0003620477|nr:hypothetical protein [Desulfurispora thermophila]